MAMRDSKSAKSVIEIHEAVYLLKMQIQKYLRTLPFSLYTSFLNYEEQTSTAYGVSNTSGHNSKHEQTSSYSLLASQSSYPQLDHEDLDQVDEYDLEEMDLKWQVVMISMRIKKFYKKTGHFARECRSKEENRRRDGWNTGNREGRRTGNRDESITGKKEESKALVTVDGESVDWTTHSEDDDNYAFMANNSSGSDTQVPSCSNECKESYANIKKLYDIQREQLSDASVEIKAYTQGLKKVEAQLVVHQQNQLWYEQKIKFMKIDLDDKTDVLTYHKTLLAKAQKEKDDLEVIVNKWNHSSKNLGKIINYSMSARDKFGLGYGDYRYSGNLSYENEVFQSVFRCNESDFENLPLHKRLAKTCEMQAVPPPMTGNYLPSGPDIEIDDSQYTYGPEKTQTSEPKTQTSEIDTCNSNISAETSELVSEPVVNESNIKVQPKVWSDAPIIEEYESDSDDEFVTVKIEGLDTPSFANKQVKTPRENVKNQSTHSQKPKVNNKELGHGFTERACFVCGSFSHLIRDCDYHVKLAKQVELNKQNMSKGNGTRERKPTWNNVQRTCEGKPCQRVQEGITNNARTPQQNGVAERKNRTLIEAARTMLADSFLPNTFWAEAVSTACYVLNRVLVTKPHNKTPYELLTDHLGKFAGKSDEGFLVGYSLQSKAFRVYNLETKRVEENLHINFLENKPNVAGKGPNWLFDLDYLTDSMNYHSVRSENQANLHADTTDGIFTHSSYDDEGAEADFTNLETVVNVSPIPTSRINPSHPSALILGDPSSSVHTRTNLNVGYTFVNFATSEAVWKSHVCITRKSWPLFKSKKIAQVVRAWIKSKNSLVKHFEDMRLYRPSKEYLQVWFNPPKDLSMSCLTTKGMRNNGTMCASTTRVVYLERTEGESLEFHEVPFISSYKSIFLMRITVPFEQQPNPSPSPSPTPIVPDSIPEPTGENLGDHSSNDASLSGNEDDMTLQNVYDLCISLCQQVSDQAKEIKLLKAKIKKLKKKAKPVIKHFQEYLKITSLQQRFPKKSFSKKQRVHKKNVSKQGRKKAKGKSSVQRDPMFEVLAEDKNDHMETDHMETKNAQTEGRTRDKGGWKRSLMKKRLSTQKMELVLRHGKS
ncbi:ribonuclease H-like domain-containing protein [Tanacetum coccineum]